MPEQLMQIRVADFMSPATFKAQRTTPLRDIDQTMRLNNIHHIPVVEGTRAVGVISDRDVLYHKRFEGWEDFPAGDCMTAAPFTATSETALADVVLLMADKKINAVIVESYKGDVIGILTSSDALKALLELLQGNPPIVFT